MRATSHLLATSLFGFVALAVAEPPTNGLSDALAHYNTGVVEGMFSSVQKRFENGDISEVELRNHFRHFYDLDSVAASNLVAWAASAPRSYVAHLALGIYYKRQGAGARGDKFIAETPQSNINQMSDLYKKAESELRLSMALTDKPYLSVFHLLTITTQFGDQAASRELLQKANELLPSNLLARARYAVSLTPRWGGAYEQIESFIATTNAEGAPAQVVSAIEAIEENDKGESLERHGRHAEAIGHFNKALELGARAGETFTSDFLPGSRNYACSGADKSLRCP